jgi:DNA helicase-2/ATP-dependent DNA helicase PcrA
MKAANALDFGDLLYRLVVAVEGDEKLRLELQRRFRHLLVDEFQDTNHVQYRLVRAIAAEHRQVTVVGDDDQSIYRWRGADRRNILGFKREFPDAHIVKLEQNYRSTQRIVRAAHAIIRHNVEREPKRLWTDNDEGSKIAIIRCADERDEAALIAGAVSDLRSAGRALSEIALFYRIHAQSRVLEEALRARNVPYRIVGGVRFYDRAEVKDMLAYLRLLANPDDDVSLLRIINVPARGIGKKSIEQLLDDAARKGRGLWYALEAAAEEGTGPARRYREFLELMKGLKARLEAGEPLAAVGYAVYADSGYKDWLDEQDSAEADARHQNVQELLGSIQELSDQNPELDLDGFLELVTLQTDADGGDEGAQERLTLMTVHAAKGLEFPVVLVAGMEENTFPYVRQTEEQLEPDWEQLEEERRLAYVAFTRARENLYLTFAAERRLFRERRPCKPSRFLLELPADDVRRVGMPQAAAPSRGTTAPVRRPMSPYGGAPMRTAPPEPRPSSSDTYVDRSEGTDLSGVRVGMRVRHAKFGRGKIVKIKPTEPPRVDVVFDDEPGVKTIQLHYLQPG